MKEIFSPHNNLVYSFFLERKHIRDLVLNALPDRITKIIDLESIEVSDDSFIDNKLVSYQSDILIHTKIQNSPLFIYILVEHKFYLYRWTIFQLLKYMAVLTHM